MLKSFSLSALAFAALDFLWLGFVVKDFNLRQLSLIGRIEDGRFDLLYAPVWIVYLLMAASVAYFVLPRIPSGAPLWQAFLNGAAMGLIAFGIFDMTNLAILKNYPVPFALVDMAWGTFAYGAVTCLARIL